jgi:hypothetical protein
MKLLTICEIHQLCQTPENLCRRYNSEPGILKIHILEKDNDVPKG